MKTQRIYYLLFGIVGLLAFSSCPSPAGGGGGVPPYIITGNDTELYTATKDGVTIGVLGQPIQDIIDEIKADAMGENCSIQFGDGTELDIDTDYVDFDGGTGGNDWGIISLSGKITSARDNTYTPNTAVYLQNGVSVTSKADIKNTGTNGNGIQNTGSGTLTISGGAISAQYAAVYNNSSCTINISGGTISKSTDTPNYAVYSESTAGGAVNISGGTISVTTGRAVCCVSAVALNISGGTISATTGRAIVVSGKTVISGGTITSANTDTIGGQGTIHSSGTNPAANAGLEISGGTIRNTSSSGAAISYRSSAGAVRLLGGTISANTTANAVSYSTSSTSNLILGGSPNITGKIFAPGGTNATIEVITGFAPGSRNYTIVFSAWSNGNIAVVNGAAFLDSFTLDSAYHLEQSGTDLIMQL